MCLQGSVHKDHPFECMKLSYLLIGMEYERHKHTKQRFFHDEVKCQRSRRDPAAIRLEIAIRVFFISSKINNIANMKMIAIKKIKYKQPRNVSQKLIFMGDEILKKNLNEIKKYF